MNDSTHVGNYLVYFPSHVYLAAVLGILKERLPERQLLVQDRAMTEAAREAFLAQFSTGNQETLIGLAPCQGQGHGYTTRYGDVFSLTFREVRLSTTLSSAICSGLPTLPQVGEINPAWLMDVVGEGLLYD